MRNYCHSLAKLFDAMRDVQGSEGVLYVRPAAEAELWRGNSAVRSEHGSSRRPLAGQAAGFAHVSADPARPSDTGRHERSRVAACLFQSYPG